MKTLPLHPSHAMHTDRPGPTPPDPQRWRLAWLFAAPHRLAFGAGALMLAATALWWAAVQLAASAGLAWRWALPPSTAHGLLFSFGFMPLFFTGFLFTAGPKWLGLGAVEARTLAPDLLAQLSGWALLLLAAHAATPMLGRVLGALGLAAVALGWTLTSRRFVRMLVSSRVPDRRHAQLVALACMGGALSLWAASAGLALGRFDLVRLVTLAGLWSFIGLVYVAVAHRMIPFFTAAALPALDAWRPMWLLWVFSGGLLFEAAGVFADALWWPQPAAVLGGRAGIELLLGALLLALAVRWGLVQSLRVRLLAMLHLGFFWLGLAFVLAGVSHAMQAASEGSLSLGHAPLHAYSMGFLGSTLLAMATRVSAGHGGRALAADGLAWALFWLLQAAVLARVLAAMAWPQALPVAATLWALAVSGWALRYGRWYGRARGDGRPG